ncbi:MAG: PAS domain S-box protein [Opitutaceae bacterium]|nr:PAS domain S-box protein [Opitutaceae bacterium]
MPENAHSKSNKTEKVDRLDWLDDSPETRNAFRSVVDGHAIILVTNASGVIIHVNERFCDISKYSREEVEGNTTQIVNSGFHEEAFFKNLWSTILSGKIWQGEICNQAKDGSTFWVDTTIFPEMNSAGEIVRYFAILTEITQLKLVEDKLWKMTGSLEEKVAERTLELTKTRDEIRSLNVELENRVAERSAEAIAKSEQFQLIFEHAPMGISWVEFGESNIYHLNERFCKIVGVTRKEGEDFENIIKMTHPEDRDKQILLMEELYKGSMDSLSVEKRYIHRSGRVVWAHLTVAVLRDAKGKVTQQFAILNDTTKRREVEIKLRESEQRFRGYVESASEILFTLSAQGILQYVSPAWSEKLGHDPIDVIGKFYTDFLHPEDREKCKSFFNSVIEQGQSRKSVEYRMRHKDGSFRWHASSGGVVLDEKGQFSYYVGVGRDISLRKKSEEALQRALQKREELERIVDRSPSIVILWRAEEGWPVEYVSDNIAKTGYTAEEFLSGEISFREVTHADDFQKVSEEVEIFSERGVDEYLQEYRIMTKTGDVLWVEDRTIVRRDENGVVTHHQGIITDVTVKHLAEEREKERKEADLKMASDIQRHLLPTVYPDNGELEVDSLYIPSSLLGGDYYDIFRVGEKQWGVVMADVSGKGAAAALIMAACRTALRIRAEGESSPVKVMQEVNRIIQADMPENMFITITYGIIDLNESVFRCCIAGHEPFVLCRSGVRSEVEYFVSTGLALGLDSGELFNEMLEEETIALGKGDLLAFYTDGVTEARGMDDEEFGRDQFVNILTSNLTEKVTVITGKVEEAIHHHVGNRTGSDDRTLLIIRMV